MKWIKKFEGFGYDDDDYINEIVRLLKDFDLRPNQVNHLLNFYQDMIEEYKNEGKVPQIFVNDIKNKLELDKGEYLNIAVPQVNSTIKYL